MSPQPRDHRIDVMRVMALGFVLLHHADDYGVEFLRLTPRMAQIDDLLTWIALAMFFTLSGYLAARPTADQATTALWSAMRRFRRLYPPFAIAMLLFFVSDLYALDSKTTLVNIALLGPWAGNATPTLWFVEILLVFQLVFALRFASGPLRCRAWSGPLFLGMFVAAGATAAWTWGFPPDPRLVLYLPAFAGGAACGEVLGSTHDRTDRTRGLLAGSAATVATTVLLGVAPIWRDLPQVGLMTVLVTAFAVCAVVATPLRPRPTAEGSRAVVRNTVLLAASGSYMAYLAHRLVFEHAARLTSSLGEVWITFAVLASIPFVLAAGVWLQRGYDAGTATRHRALR